MHAASASDSPSLAHAERIVRTCFGSIEYVCVNAAQDTAVFFVGVPFLTYENYGRWESPEIQRALPTGLACHIASFPVVFQINPVRLRMDECAWQHGYYDQLLRGPRYTPTALIGQPYQTIYLDCRAPNDPLAPIGMQRMDIEDARRIYAFNEYRRDLFDDFDVLLGFIRNLFGAINAVWLTGSFASSKEHPGDLDAVFAIDSRLYRAAEANPKKKRMLDALLNQRHKKKLNLAVHAMFIQDVPGDLCNASRGSGDELSQNIMDRGGWIEFFREDIQNQPDSERPDPPLSIRGILEMPVDSLADVEHALIASGADNKDAPQPHPAQAQDEANRTDDPVASPQLAQCYLHQDSARFKQIVRRCAKEESVPVQDIIQEYFAFLILERLSQCWPELVLKGGLPLKRVHHLIDRGIGDMDIALSAHGNNSSKDAFFFAHSLEFAVEKVGLRLLHYTDELAKKRTGTYFVALPDFGFDDCGHLKIELSLEAPVTHVESICLQSSVMHWLESQSDAQDYADKRYLDAPSFTVQTQTVEASFCDKVLAVCDAPHRPAVPFHGKSRHLYDLYRLAQHLELNECLFVTLQEVRAEAPRHPFYASAQEDFDIAGTLRDLYWTQIYRRDYQWHLTSILTDETPYDTAATVLLQVADWLCTMTGDVAMGPADYAAQLFQRAKINRSHVDWNLKAVQGDIGNDLAQARSNLIADSCYNIHQCIELCMKASLSLNEMSFPKTHSLIELRRMVQDGDSLFSEAVLADLARIAPLCATWESDARYQPRFAPVGKSLELACDLADAMLVEVESAMAG